MHNYLLKSEYQPDSPQYLTCVGRGEGARRGAAFLAWHKPGTNFLSHLHHQVTEQ